MTSPTTYSVVSWIDPQDRKRTDPRWTRTYGTAPTPQAAILLAEEVLTAGTDYVIVTATETVHSAVRRADSPRLPVGGSRAFDPGRIPQSPMGRRVQRRVVRAVGELASQPRPPVADSLSGVQASRPALDRIPRRRIRETAEDTTVAEERAPYDDALVDQRGDDGLERLDTSFAGFSERSSGSVGSSHQRIRAGHPMRR